jgi:rubrerythrin
MPDLSGTKTEMNLRAAFAGECQARGKYSHFASIARKEGYEQIADVFQKTADQEQEHASVHLQLLAGAGNTQANLKAAAAGENSEWTRMYPTMAREAKAEGFEDIARVFEWIASIEKRHEARYHALLEDIEKSGAFAKATNTKWSCRSCGFVCEGLHAFAACPVCKSQQASFEAIADKA